VASLLRRVRRARAAPVPPPTLALVALDAVTLPDGWQLQVVVQTESTNVDLREAARAGTVRPGHVLIAIHQRAGRGRLDRRWESEAGTGLTFSVLVDPSPVPVALWGWLPLLAGLAVAEGAGAAAGVPLRVKWPNDVQSPDGRKVAGILSERVDTAQGPRAVVGIGLNVSSTPEQLPVPTAGSLAMAGGTVHDPGAILGALLAALAARLAAWRAAGGDAAAAGLLEDYAAASVTLGADVTVTLPGGDALPGTALRIAPDGSLVLRTVNGERTVSAGDVG
jgi:BirA family transcriptional regulator, biotin operon repressor / biotin---[acetyl-CoA-carboxylase] ligase